MVKILLHFKPHSVFVMHWLQVYSEYFNEYRTISFCRPIANYMEFGLLIETVVDNMHVSQ